jgi:hypothetical protein
MFCNPTNNFDRNGNRTSPITRLLLDSRTRIQETNYEGRGLPVLVYPDLSKVSKHVVLSRPLRPLGKVGPKINYIESSGW